MGLFSDMIKLYRILYEQDSKRRVSLAVLKHGDKVLILKRVMNENDRYGGRWGFPGGGIEDGENPLEAVIRECEEEIGVRPIGLEYLSQNGRITWFLGELPCDPEDCVSLDYGEHDDWEMVGIDDMGGYDMIEGMKEIIFDVVS